MLKKLYVVSILAAILLFALQGMGTAQAAQVKEYSAERYDSAIAIQADGSLLITESILFRFVGGPFTYVTRAIPTNKTDGISIVTASMDGAAFPEGSDAGQVEIKKSNPVTVKWHFQPKSDQRHLFELTYRVQGVVQKASDADVLRWLVLPTDHDYKISSTTTTFSYANKGALISTPETDPSIARIRSDPQKVTFTTDQLNPDETLEIRLRFQPGSVISQEPAWQRREEIGNDFVLPGILGGAIIFVLGLLGLNRYYRKHQRRDGGDWPESGQISAPPGDLAPALAGVLANEGGSPGWPQFVATLFDLARRGILNIVESTEPKKWHQSHPDYLVVKRDVPERLLPHEAALITILFVQRSRDTSAEGPTITEVGKLYTKHAKLYNQAVNNELTEVGCYDQERQRVKGRLTAIAGTTLALGVVGTFLGFIIGGLAGPWPLGFLGIGLIGVCIAAFIFTSMYSPLSNRWQLEAKKWQAFGRYLKSIIGNKEANVSAEDFEQYLPYATSFGILDRWTKFFEHEGVIFIPVWFSTIASNPREQSSSFYYMTGSMHTNSSSGSGAGASFGGGGAAGGGSSGAG